MATGFNFFSIAFTASLFLLVLSFLVHAIKSLCCNIDNEKDREKNTLMASTLCLFGIGCMVTCMFICILIAMAPIYFVDHQFAIQFSGYVVATIGTGFVTTFFLHSLYVTSKETKYGYSPCLIWSIGIFQCVFLGYLILHQYYIFFVDMSVYSYYFYILMSVQLPIRITLLFMYNRILYLVAKQSFIHSDEKKA